MYQKNLGLCTYCDWSKQIKTAKKSSFIMCNLSKIDQRYTKYPQLPLLECEGFFVSSE